MSSVANTLTLLSQRLFECLLELWRGALRVETDKSLQDAAVARDDEALRNVRASLHQSERKCPTADSTS